MLPTVELRFSHHLEMILTLLFLVSIVSGEVYFRPDDFQVEEEHNASFEVIFTNSDVANIYAISEDKELATVAKISKFGSVNGSGFSVVVYGLRIGITHVLIQTKGETYAYPIDIIRSKLQEKLSFIFTVVLAAVIFGNTFIMGLQLDLNVIKEVLKKPIGPLIGFLAQYGFMPLIATVWALLLLKGNAVFQFGLFAIGCSPGGGGSNAWTLLLDGNLDLSVTMTFFSNIAALGMMPAWVFSLGRIFFAGQVRIPFLDMFKSLAAMIGPIFLGILVRKCRPDWPEKTRTFLKFSSFIIVLLLGPFGLYTNFYCFYLFNWKVILAGLLLPYTGFILSYAMAYLAKQNKPDRITIAIETGIQNAAIAAVLLRFSLPQPEADLGFVLPFCVILFTPIPLLIFLLILTLKKCIVYYRKKRAGYYTVGVDQPFHGFQLTDSVRFIDSMIESVELK